MRPLVQAADADPLVRQVIDTRYRLIRELAHGGMGRVFEAVDTELRRKVAIKLISSASADATARARFHREALTLAQLSHPNVLTVYDAGPKEREGDPYLVCELLEGITLRERIASPLPLSDALEIATQIAAGLAAAHALEIVHRDLKPDNVFITRDGRVKLIDFGIAKPLLPVETLSAEASAAMEPDAATAEGRMVGTVGYMAPEQVRGAPVDCRADVFSFGAVLYELVGGHRAFQGATPYATSLAILDDAPAPLPHSLPASVRHIVERCLEKDPAMRFSSARELLPLLEDAHGAWIRRRLRARRRPWLIGAGVVAVSIAALMYRPPGPSASRSLVTLRIAPVQASPANAPVAAALGLAFERAFGAMAEIVRVEQGDSPGGGEWVLRTLVSAAGPRLRVVAKFEAVDGRPLGKRVESVGSATEIEQEADDLAARASDEFMRLWRDGVRRRRAHELSRSRAAEEKLLAYYDLMGPAPRAEFLDRGRRLLDDALGVDEKNVPALVARAMLLLLAADRPGDDSAADVHLARADADEAVRLSPRDAEALLAECLTARRQMRDRPSDAELNAATSACSATAQADPQSVVALYTLALLYDQTCDDGPFMETLKTAIGRAARYDRTWLARLEFYLVSSAIQRSHLQEADVFSAELIAQLAREERRHKPSSPPMQGAHLLRAAVLLRLDRGADADSEIEAELAEGATAIGGLQEILEAASLRGLARIRRGTLDPARAARLAVLERKFAAEDERSDQLSRVVGWFGFMDPEGAVAWMDAHKTQPGCQLAFQRATIYRDAGHGDRAARAIAGCTPTEEWAKRCARVISSDLPPGSVSSSSSGR